VNAFHDVTQPMRQQQLLQDRESKAQFLSDAGACWHSSLDYEATLRAVARLARAARRRLVHCAHGR
jgi:hypothetical protein